MDLNDVYEKIIEVEGDCFKGKNKPPCSDCPFADMCLELIINEAKPITNDQRLKWALDKLVEGVIFDEKR